MQTRRRFITQTTLAAGALFTSSTVLSVDNSANEIQRLTILHTNDVHSRLDPFPMDGSRIQGLGGVAQRSALIQQIRNEVDHVLLLDAGDIFQGTPYFNIYKGEPEIKAMSAMKYDAATIGNHDFDGGLNNLPWQLQHADFPILICNYDFSGTPMRDRYKEYNTFKKGKLKIGVTGVGIELRGLVPDNLFGNTKYLDPISNVNRVALKLKNEENCDLVICLSHLGFRYQSDKVSDEVLATQSENIDLIIGGHSHTFFEKPLTYKNKNGYDVIVNQVGWGGIVLGRLDFEFSKMKNKNLANSHTVVIGKKTRE